MVVVVCVCFTITISRWPIKIKNNRRSAVSGGAGELHPVQFLRRYLFVHAHAPYDVNAHARTRKCALTQPNHHQSCYFALHCADGAFETSMQLHVKLAHYGEARRNNKSRPVRRGVYRRRMQRELQGYRMQVTGTPPQITPAPSVDTFPALPTGMPS